MKPLFALVLIAVLVLILCSCRCSRESYTSSPSILHLVLYSPEPHYKKMYEQTRRYYHSLPNVKTLYYCYSPTLSDEHQLVDDILYIKGKETYLPGILLKTIRAFEIGQTLGQFDYIIRSNSSTVVDIPKLLPLLQKNKVQYGGSFIHNLQWIDPAGGIKDQSLWGTRYASGTCIVFDRQTLQTLLQHKDKLNQTVIDDVAIGLWVKTVLPSLPMIGFLDYFKTVDSQATLDSLLKKDNQTIFYRNRTSNRDQDAQQIERIVDWLIKESK